MDAEFEERLQQLRQSYLADLPQRLERIRRAYEDADRVALQHEAHRLAGTGFSYGLPELSAWGRTVEAHCKTAEPLATIADEIAALEQLVATLLAADSTPPETPRAPS